MPYIPYLASAWAPTDEKHVVLTGTEWVSTPDNGGAPVDIDVMVCVALADWDPAANVDESLAAQAGAWRFWRGQSGFMEFGVSSDGVGLDSVVTTSKSPAADGGALWVRMRHTDAGDNDFFYATYELEEPTTWVGPAGWLNRSTTAATVFDSASPIEVGSRSGGTLDLVIGSIYRVIVKSAGVAILDMDPRDYVSGTSWVSSRTGETWTLNNGATIFPAPVVTNAPADIAVSTGVGNNTTGTLISPSGIDAGAIGAGQDAIVTVLANAVDASATGVGQNATPLVSPVAIDASATGAGQDAQLSLLVNATTVTASSQGIDATGANITIGAGQAAATGAASDAVVTVGNFANATDAAATGAAFDATVTAVSFVNATAQDAAATGTASDGATTITTNGGQAAGTGAGQDATSALLVNGGSAAATGLANDSAVTALAFDDAPAQMAAGTGLANNSTVTISASPESITATGQALDASAPGGTVVSAEQAIASGVAFEHSLLVTPTSDTGVSTGAGTDASPLVSTKPLDASGTIQGLDPGVDVLAVVLSATSTGLANNASGEVGARIPASDAAASGAAFDPAVSQTSAVDAGSAIAVGEGLDATIQADTGVLAGSASGTGTGLDALISTDITVVAHAASATGEAFAGAIFGFGIMHLTTGIGTSEAFGATISVKRTIGFVWDGERWVPGVFSVWDGNEWDEGRLEMWSGAGWK